MAILASILKINNCKENHVSLKKLESFINSNGIPEGIKKILIKYNEELENQLKNEIENQNSDQAKNVKWPNLSSIYSKSFSEILNFFVKLCPFSVQNENKDVSEYIGIKQNLNLNFNVYIYEKRNLNNIDYNYIRIWTNFLYTKNKEFEAIKFNSMDNCFTLIILKNIPEISLRKEDSLSSKLDKNSKLEHQKDSKDINFDNLDWVGGIYDELLLPSFNIELDSENVIKNCKIEKKYLNTIWNKISISMLSEKLLPFNLQYVNSQTTFIIEDECLLYIFSNKKNLGIDIPIISIDINKSNWQISLN